MYQYESHIVAYGKSDLKQVPQPFFLNLVTSSSQGFSGIASVETNSVEKAYKSFAQGSEWSEAQINAQGFFGCHVKLEQIKEHVKIIHAPLKTLPQSPIRRRLIQSPLVAAWDVHLDGEFDPPLQEWLTQQEGYLLLEYTSQKGKACRTLTLHFLRQQECQNEYHRVVEEIKKTGGFSGIIYWEDPLAFVVYGPTFPRPIVL